MASRIIHYVISDIVSKEIYIENYNRFIYGSLAPDMSNHDDGSYKTAHFGSEQHGDIIKGIDYIKFYLQYKNKILKDDFLLGYYMHLITDAYWLKNIYAKHVRRKNKQERDNLQQLGYSDMKNYNALLIKEYNLKPDIKKEDISIDEVNPLLADLLFERLYNDFSCELIEDISFNLYSSDVIHNFINEAAEKCIYEINAIKNGTEQGNPKDLFIEVLHYL